MLFCLAKFFLGEMLFKKRCRHPGSYFLWGEMCEGGGAEILRPAERDSNKKLSRLSVLGEARRGLAVLSKQVLLISENPWDSSCAWQGHIGLLSKYT